MVKKQVSHGRMTHLTNYFKESSCVLRTHGTREEVVSKCVKSVKNDMALHRYTILVRESMALLMFYNFYL